MKSIQKQKYVDAYCVQSLPLSNVARFCLFRGAALARVDEASAASTEEQW